MQNILFIDRDGTLVEEPDDYQVDDLAKIRLRPQVIPSLLRLVQAGYRLVMVSNQDGLGTDSFPEENFQRCQDFILQLFSSQGIQFDEIFICPHTEGDNCLCRKPKTGLLQAFFRAQSINLERSCVIGDRASDQVLAANLGIAYLPISTDHDWSAVADSLLSMERKAAISRKTKETDIRLSLNLASDKPTLIQTPIGFFSHMLEQIARHAGFSLQLTAKGDTEVDEHHLIEDTAIALGEGLKKALGNKWGINRYGFTLPMDEALASVSLDLCGRSFCAFDAPFTREFVGGMATEMVPHFFNSFAASLGATLHISVQGENHHHMIESCFKALGRTLNQAIAETGSALPSTKGIL